MIITRIASATPIQGQGAADTPPPPRSPLSAGTMPPEGTHTTYQLQYRRCGKPACRTCREGKGHGPYWYGYFREGGKLRSRYVGKSRPDGLPPPAAAEAEAKGGAP